VVGDADDFVVGDVVGEAVAVDQEEVEVFAVLLLREFEGVAGQEAAGGHADAFY
jgi:hypothetical protein